MAYSATDFLSNIIAVNPPKAAANDFIDIIRDVRGSASDLILAAQDPTCIYGELVIKYNDFIIKYNDVLLPVQNITSNMGAIDAVNANITSIASVSTILTDISVLNSISNELQSLYADKAVLDSLYADKVTLDSLYADKVTLDRVYSSIANVDTISGNIVSVDTVATNIVDVQNALANATAAQAAEASAIAAMNSTSAIFDSFDDRYLGTKSVEPTLDNDGNTLLVGAIYYDSVLLTARFWNGTVWESPDISASSAASYALDRKLEAQSNANEAENVFTNTFLDGVATNTTEYSAKHYKLKATTEAANALISETNSASSATLSASEAAKIVGLTTATTTLAAGSASTSSYDSSTGVLTLGIPIGDTGSTGVGISSIVFTSTTDSGGLVNTPGATDTYTITYDDTTTSTFTVYNGAIGSTGLTGLTGVTGNGISSISFTSTTDTGGLAGAAGATDTYTTTYTDTTTSTFTVYNGADGTGTGDMSKSVYDTTGTGIVDNSELINGLTVDTAVPVGALFTDTNTDTVAAMTDTTITTPAAKEALIYDGVNGVWINAAVDHLDLLNIGTNNHAAIDTHIADATIHYTQASIAITESQITDLQPYLLTETSHADVLVDGDFASAGLMKTDGLGTYSIDANTYLTTETSHADVLVDSDFSTAGLMKTDGLGVYSIDATVYEPTFTKNTGFNLATGTAAGTVATGDHLHTGVYEPVDATIVKDADIGVTVQAYDATIVVDADIGVTIQGYDVNTTKNNIANTFILPQRTSITTATSVSADMATQNNFILTVGATATVTAVNLTVGQSGIIIVTDAANIVGWDALFIWGASGVPDTSAYAADATFAYFIDTATTIQIGLRG